MDIKDTNVTINVRNLNQSILFYEGIGLQIKKRWGEHYAQMTAPDITIGLHPTEEMNWTGTSGTVSIGFATDDFENAKSILLKQHIVVTERKEAGGQFLYFNDLDGTSLYFIKPK
ncbi:MAG: VOC family protein [Maribacter sp.]|nr:VOC family protein [Maribacter sp.]